MQPCRPGPATASPDHPEPGDGIDPAAAFDADLRLCVGSLRRIADLVGSRPGSVDRDRLQEGLLQVDDLLTLAMFRALDDGPD